MNTALFTYQIRVKVNNEDTVNVNYINPLNVTSFFWETKPTGKPVLNVFLNAVKATQNGSNAYSITFGEIIGTKFVNHMEEFLCLLLGSGRITQNQTTQPRERHARRVVEAEIVEEEVSQAAAEWAS